MAINIGRWAFINRPHVSDATEGRVTFCTYLLYLLS
jgi:hypothetical protein